VSSDVKAFGPSALATPANVLTLGRLLAGPAFAVVIAEVNRASWTLFALWLVLSLSDGLDGWVARWHGTTRSGAFLDPLADKFLVCSAFIAFVGRHWMPAWMAVIVVARELAITGLRLLAASKNLVLAAEGFGKHKTISQIVAILSILVFHSYQQWGSFGRLIFGFPESRPWIVCFTAVSLWVAVILTFTSGTLYLWRNRGLYLADL